MSVVSLDSRRPHLVVDSRSIDGMVHVYPVSYWRDWAAGKPVGVEPPTDVLRRIVAEWLGLLEQDEPGGGAA